jgi:hypothetical protein
MNGRKAVTRETGREYQRAGKKEKGLILGQYVRLTGYNRKYAIRILSMPFARTAAMAVDGKTAAFKAEKKPGPKNRPGKPLYTGETAACLANIRRFYWYKYAPIRPASSGKKSVSPR